MTFIFKEHVKIVQINVVKLNLTLYNFNKTATKLFKSIN